MVGKSKFGERDLIYRVPEGLLYPVLAAFRSLLAYNGSTEKYEWKNRVSPMEMWKKCRKEVAEIVMNFSAAIGDNPNAVGKAPTPGLSAIWLWCVPVRGEDR